MSGLRPYVPVLSCDFVSSLYLLCPGGEADLCREGLELSVPRCSCRTWFLKVKLLIGISNSKLINFLLA